MPSTALERLDHPVRARKPTSYV